MIVLSVPKLRFPEFSGEWGETKLGSISDKISDGIHSTPKYKDGTDYFFVNGNNLVNKRILVNENNTKTVSKEEFEKYKKNLGKQTILISINGTIGNLAYYANENVILGKSAAYINLKSDEVKEFIYNYIQTHKINSFFNGELTGTTIKNLSLATLKNTPLFLPNLEEQQKIASFLSKVDSKIDQLEKKQELWETYKKGIMQQVFSQKLRFKDENGDEYPDWGEKRLEEVAEVCGGGTPSTGKNEYWNGSINWFTPSEVGKEKYMDTSLRKISESGLKNSSAKLLPPGTILVSSRATIGEMSILTTKGTTNQGFQSLIIKEKYHNEFIYYLGDILKKEMTRRASGSTFLEISKNEVKKIRIKVPFLAEQIGIAKFLSAIDIKIKGIENELEIMRKFKNGLLQQMFC